MSILFALVLGGISKPIPGVEVPAPKPVTACAQSGDALRCFRSDGVEMLCINGVCFDVRAEET